MNIKHINEATRDNFFNHIDFAKDSEFFRKYDIEFFKDLDIFSPPISKEEILEKLVQTKIIDKLDNLNIDNDTLKFIEKIGQKEIKINNIEVFDNFNINSDTLKFIEEIRQKEINNIDPKTLKTLKDSLNENMTSSIKPSKLKV